MSKCESWIKPPNPYSDARCLATKETEWCSCGGDQTKCDFYREIRDKAKRKRDIQAAIAHYNMGINEDIFSPEVATYARLAVEALRKMEEC